MKPYHVLQTTTKEETWYKNCHEMDEICLLFSSRELVQQPCPLAQALLLLRSVHLDGAIDLADEPVPQTVNKQKTRSVATPGKVR